MQLEAGAVPKKGLLKKELERVKGLSVPALHDFTFSFQSQRLTVGGVVVGRRKVLYYLN